LHDTILTPANITFEYLSGNFIYIKPSSAEFVSLTALTLF
jgi:hypothetical protein